MFHLPVTVRLKFIIVVEVNSDYFFSEGNNHDADLCQVFEVYVGIFVSWWLNNCSFIRYYTIYKKDECYRRLMTKFYTTLLELIVHAVRWILIKSPRCAQNKPVEWNIAYPGCWSRSILLSCACYGLCSSFPPFPHTGEGQNLSLVEYCRYPKVVLKIHMSPSTKIYVD